MQTQEGYEADESEEIITRTTYAQLAMGVGEHVTARAQITELQQIFQKMEGRGTLDRDDEVFSVRHGQLRSQARAIEQGK